MSDTFGEGQNWFYVREGRRQGPFDRRRLLEALIALDQPEGTLVWRSGLGAWTRAGDLKELRDDLPPPIPRDAAADASDRAAIAPPPPLPTEDEIATTLDTSPESEAKTPAEEQEGDEPEGRASSPPGSPGETEEALRRRRRHRKRRHSESRLTPRLLRLLAMFLILALVLWFLLHRLNEMPAGRIILEGALRP
jgi:hypothetical protein